MTGFESSKDFLRYLIFIRPHVSGVLEIEKVNELSEAEAAYQLAQFWKLQLEDKIKSYLSTPTMTSRYDEMRNKSLEEVFAYGKK